jgi:hypothetical protein
MRIRELLHDEAAVEPLVMKLLAAVALLIVGLGIGIGLYKRAGAAAESMLENAIENLAKGA